MKVTKEIIDKDIAGLEQQLEQLKASVAQVTGALSVLKGINTYLEIPEPPEISEVNKAIQEELESAVSGNIGYDDWEIAND